MNHCQCQISLDPGVVAATMVAVRRTCVSVRACVYTRVFLECVCETRKPSAVSHYDAIIHIYHKYTYGKHTHNVPPRVTSLSHTFTYATIAAIYFYSVSVLLSYVGSTLIPR